MDASYLPPLFQRNCKHCGAEFSAKPGQQSARSNAGRKIKRRSSESGRRGTMPSQSGSCADRERILIARTAPSARAEARHARRNQGELLR
jgi:hypothetical protein